MFPGGYSGLAGTVSDHAACDVMFMDAGAIRSKELGPAVTLGYISACFPFGDTLGRYTITGSQLIPIFAHILRPENRDGEGECYDVSAAVLTVYNDRTKTLDSLTINGESVVENSHYSIGLIGYHVDNSVKTSISLKRNSPGLRVRSLLQHLLPV